MVTHRPAEQPPGGGFVFVFVEAIDQAKAAADEKQVHVMGGADLIRRARAAGLAGEVTIIIAPVTVGVGKVRRVRRLPGTRAPWSTRVPVRDVHRLPR